MDSSGNGCQLTVGPDAANLPRGKFGNMLDADATEADGLGAYRFDVEEALNPDDSDFTVECWIQAKPDMVSDGNRVCRVSTFWGLARSGKRGSMIKAANTRLMKILS